MFRLLNQAPSIDIHGRAVVAAGRWPKVAERCPSVASWLAMSALRLTSIVEATTYLVLLGAVLAYRLFSGPDLTSAIGPVHGIAFLAYFAMVLHAREDLGWTQVETVTALVAAALPLGGYVIAHRLMKQSEPAAGIAN